MKLTQHASVALLAFAVYLHAPSYTHLPSWYQLSTSVRGVHDLLQLSASEAAAGADAYSYMINMSNIANTSVTEQETEHVRAYYNVIQRMLAVADIEKLYIPPQLGELSPDGTPRASQGAS